MKHLRRAIHILRLCFLCHALQACTAQNTPQPKAPCSKYCIRQPLHAQLDKAFLMKSCIPWNHTGIHLEKGNRYLILAWNACGEPYTDKGVRATADGVHGLKGRLLDGAGRDATGRSLLARLAAYQGRKEGGIRRLRVLQDAEQHKAHFLTLIAAIGEDDSEANVHVIGQRGCFMAQRSGELVLFSNDWPGGPGTEWYGDERFKDSPTYQNNSGGLIILVTECPACQPPTHTQN